MSTHSLARRTAALIVLTVLCNSVGNLLLSLGMKHVGQVSTFSAGVIGTTAWQVATSGAIWLGIVTLALFFAAHMLLLSWADYSYVEPASAAGYALVPLTAFAIFGEPMSSARWAGVLLIAVGVGLVGRTPSRTTESRTVCEPSSV